MGVQIWKEPCMHSQNFPLGVGLCSGAKLVPPQLQTTVLALEGPLEATG